jgi:hypothetical protein
MPASARMGTPSSEPSRADGGAVEEGVPCVCRLILIQAAFATALRL